MTITLGLFLLALALPAAHVPPNPELADWTILFYGASDNSSEESFCPDMAAARQGLRADANLNLLAIVDRSPGFTATTLGFGEDFHDTRLYRFTADGPERIGGGDEFPEITTESNFEANTADAVTLRKSLRWMKATYPAKHYALVFYSHGSGPTFCPDDTSNGDKLYPAELTAVLAEQDSVDLLVFDVCLMAGVENAYQWRPSTGEFSANVMVATPMAGFPFPWDSIFERFGPGDASSGASPRVDPAGASAADFGRLIVEETERHRRGGLADEGLPAHLVEVLNGESMTCLDLTAMAEVKTRVDALAQALFSDEGRGIAESVRGEIGSPTTLCYAPAEERGQLPYVDLYDFAIRLARHSDADDRDDHLSERARAVAEAVESAVITSYGLDRYDTYGGFQVGRHGLYIVFPDQATFGSVRWYHPGDVDSSPAYGHYAWCADGATEADGEVGNWFELLDAWFDARNEAGGMNHYRL